MDQPVHQARPETCPHDLPGETANRYRQARAGEKPDIVSMCVRCETKVYAVRRDRPPADG